MFKCQINWSSKLPKLQGKEEEIINLHVNDKIPINQLAQIYECSRRPLIRIIENNGFKTRPSTSPELEGREDEIIKMYIDDLLTIQTIRKKIGCTFNTIKGFLKRNNIKLRTADESRKTEDGKVKGTTQRLIDPKDLQDAIEMYESGEVLEKIGEKYNISPRGLQMKFRKLGIDMRSATESANLPTTYDRKKVTNMENWGVENPTQSQLIYDRIKSTNLEKYGVEYVMQHPAIFELAQKSGFKYKTAELHGKLFTQLQGYEPQGVAYLIEQMDIGVDDIISGKKVPKVSYNFENKNKIYYPDIFVISKNLLVEIKCQYTYEKELEKNIAKRKASIEAGYNFLTIIFDKNGKDVYKMW